MSHSAPLPPALLLPGRLALFPIAIPLYTVHYVGKNIVSEEAALEKVSELEWNGSFGSMNVVPADDKLYRSKSHSPRPCPGCGNSTLVRWPLPGRLRVFRRIGLNLRHYACDSCNKRSIIRSR